MRYTVKQLASLAGVTRRTLHHYDAIGLLSPAVTGENGYRYYDETSALQLQQILFYRQLGLSLEEIKDILQRPGFDLLQALQGHRQALLERAAQLDHLIHTVDQTLRHLRGEITMSPKDFYAGFDEQQQEHYEEEARQRWGEASVAESARRWKSCSREQKNAILAEGNQITQAIADAMEQGYDHPQVQYWIGRWYQSINTNFYDCSLEVFEALGHGYVSDARFTAFYEKVKPGLARFMEQAMVYYCEQAR
jgi:DNA-binding transcriptional MerR regulator